MSRPSDKSRLYYLVLLFLLIQYNIVGALFPDNKIDIPITIQNIIAYIVALVMSLYFIFYIYKVLNLEKLRFYAFQGSLIFIVLPFIFLFLFPYVYTGDLEMSRRLVVIIPFVYVIVMLFSLAKSFKEKYLSCADESCKEEMIGVLLGFSFWLTLPVIAFFETDINHLLLPILKFHNGSQVAEVISTNLGLLVMTVLFIRKSIKQSRAEYYMLLDSKKMLQELNHTLTLKVIERTKELEIANERRTNTFINLAHESKTPITLIRNYLEEYIGKHGETEELLIIKRSIEKLTRDINNFFDLEKIKRGDDIYFNDQICNVSEILNNNIELYRAYANKKGIFLTSYVDDNLIVKADPEGIYRILNNLVENAIKFTSLNGVIQISLKQEGQSLLFVVRDNGIGIHPELHEKIFEPYFKINSSHKNIQGIGIGLSLVKKIVESIGGVIRIESDPSTIVGTNMIIEIPICNNEYFGGPLSLKSREVYFNVEALNIPQLRYNAEKRSVLIVEDNFALLNYLATKLSERFNVIAATSGNEAFERLQTVTYVDIIISDVMMDDGDGFDLYRSILSRNNLNHIPFIFLTAKDSAKSKIEGLLLGAVDYIQKPFLVEELVAKIDSILLNLEKQRIALINSAYKSLQKASEIDLSKADSQNKFEINCQRYNLTTREIEIINLIAKGVTYKSSGELLYISDKTVAKHVRNIFEKVDVKKQVELLSKLEVSV
ncbi:ATP-binding protein [Sporocytophaga sp.]|uniref:ATP-binding response regulator n=1 Tax=Sporocytophaga sp. TaxID=2231183 RepID=UPI0025D3113D|nr:ATP-binding protein [Sporocytophaga sp.]